MKKIKIFDTNVFLSDPNALFNYPKELVVIPISVIEEIDEFKKSLNELGRNARHILRKLDKLRKRGKISSKNPKSKRSKKSLPGIALNNGGRLIIELNHTDSIPDGLSKDKVDNRILAVALYYKKEFPNSDVELITKDANLRIKADSFDIKASDYEKASDILSDSIYKGYQSVILDLSDYEVFKRDKRILLPESIKNIQPNEFVKIQTSDLESEILLGKYDIVNNQILSLNKKDVNEMINNWKIAPTNIEQQLALDALLNPEIPLITISGKAGTGKTLLAVLAGLYQALDKDLYDKILISRPVMPMGKDIGYLPGTTEEKMSPWMQPIFDNLEYLFSQNATGSLSSKFTKSPKRQTYTSYEELVNDGFIKVEPLMFIRGRSIPKQFIIIDEAQNLTLHEVKTIITRAGKGTKIIFTGDPEQIDNPYVDQTSNGLTQIIERLKDEKVTAHIHLLKGERSELAEIVSDKLK